MSGNFSIEKTENTLKIQQVHQVVLLKAEPEEIWLNGQLLASYEAIDGIKVEEEQGSYHMKLQIEDKPPLVIANSINEVEMKRLVEEIWVFLGLEL